MPEKTLRAVYTAPGGSSQIFSSILPPLPSNDANNTASNVAEKTAYLEALRKSTTHLQSEVNAFLTKRMEEDAKTTELSSASTKTQEAQERREEEMYGEEDGEEDA